MTRRERFLRVFNFEKPQDRLPMIEWAPWWDLTLKRWKQEGIPADMSGDEAVESFGLDPLICLGGSAYSAEAGVLSPTRPYSEMKEVLYNPGVIAHLKKAACDVKERHDRGEIVIRLWLDGFFWFPRLLFGIEPHLYAFYDQAELMHTINTDLAAFNIQVIEELFPLLRPDMVGFAEDMSYNNGPMLSHDLFREFLLPYYQRVIPVIKSFGVKVLIDSDGDITRMVPWMEEAGIEGVYPLERQAGVDVAKIRREHPRFLMMGAYDKMVMPKGEREMRAEFERLLPVMRSGGFVPSVDHQTPPGVSLENYRIYLRLFEEYVHRAAE